MLNYLQKLRLFSRDVRLYLFTSALVGFSWIGIYAVLFNLYLLRLGYDLTFVGMINAVASLVYAIACLPCGALGGRWGSRRSMILGLCVSSIGLGLTILTEFVPIILQARWLLVTYSLAWIGASLYLVNANPFLMGNTGPDERDYVFSMQVALWPLAGAAGNLVGGMLPGIFAKLLDIQYYAPAPYRYSLLLAAILFSLNIPVLLAMRDVAASKSKARSSEKIPAPYGLIALLSLVVGLQIAGVIVVRTFFNVYLDVDFQVATHQIGTLVAIGRFLSAPAALLAPLLMTRIGKTRSFITASIGVVLFSLPLALIPHTAAAAIGYAGVVSLAAIAQPAIMVYQQESVTSDWQATMSGATSMGMGLSSAAMSFASGYIAALLSYRSLFLIGAGVTLVGVLLFWVYCCTVLRRRAVQGRRG